MPLGPSAANGKDERSHMKKSSLTSQQSRLAQLFKEVLRILQHHHVKKTHVNPKAIYAAASTFSADTIATLPEGEQPFRAKIVELLKLLADYILAEIRWAAKVHDRFKEILEPVFKLDAAVTSGATLPEELLSSVETRLGEGKRAISDLCRAIAEKLFEVFTLLRTVWPEPQPI